LSQPFLHQRLHTCVRHDTWKRLSHTSLVIMIGVGYTTQRTALFYVTDTRKETRETSRCPTSNFSHRTAVVQRGVYRSVQHSHSQSTHFTRVNFNEVGEANRHKWVKLGLLGQSDRPSRVLSTTNHPPPATRIA
jgi:hypothetical protein